MHPLAERWLSPAAPLVDYSLLLVVSFWTGAAAGRILDQWVFSPAPEHPAPERSNGGFAVRVVGEVLAFFLVYSLLMMVVVRMYNPVWRGMGLRREGDGAIAELQAGVALVTGMLWVSGNLQKKVNALL